MVRQSEAGPNTANASLALVSPLAKSIIGVVKRPNAGVSSIAAVLSSPSSTPFFSMWARIGASLLAVMNDDTEAAGEQYTALKPSAGIMGVYVNVDRVLGLLARTTGDRDAAASHFEDALTFCRRAEYRTELAWTCHDYADTLLGGSAAQDGRGGSPRQVGAPPRDANLDKALTLLDEAIAVATELGMRPLMERVTALQAQAQAQPAPAPTYPDGLSQREVEVLRLIAIGKTDREIGEELFISVRTVGNHVRSILNKTTVANRTEAASYAAHRGLDIN